MLTKFHNILNLKKWLQVVFRTFYRASESFPFNRRPWIILPRIPLYYISDHLIRIIIWVAVVCIIAQAVIAAEQTRVRRERLRVI
jgi:hypothetical protein